MSEDNKEASITAVPEASKAPAQPKIAAPAVHSPEVEQIKTLLRDHGITALVCVGLVLAVILGTSYYQSSSKKKLGEANALLFESKNMQDLEKLVNEYPKTPSAPLGLLRLAKVYFSMGNYAMSLNKYIEFEKKYPEHLMLDDAVMGKTHCVEAMGQLQQAMSSYEEFYKKNPKHHQAAEAIFGQARCLEQLGRDREAKALYEDFVTTHSESKWIPRAKDLLDSVTKRLQDEDQSPEDAGLTAVSKEEAAAKVDSAEPEEKK